MDIVVIVSLAAVAWIGHAVGLAWLMSRRGFHPLPWAAVSFLLGPAVWPLAALDLVSGPPGPELLKRGAIGDGSITVLAAFDRDELTERASAQLKELIPQCNRLVLARVILSGGPTFVRTEAERFLRATAKRLGAQKSELQLHHGVFDRVITEIESQDNFSIVVRSDQSTELFDGNGSRREMRGERDVAAA